MMFQNKNKKISSVQERIHKEALQVAEKYKRAEFDLICILQKIDQEQVFRAYGYTSLYTYAQGAMGLSKDVASNFIVVARAAKKYPVLQAAIRDQRVQVSKVRKVTPVLTPESAHEWVKKIETLPQHQLEREVARVSPREAVPERMRYISEDRLELRMSISEELAQKMRRIQDLESQRMKRAASLEDALLAMAEVYLEGKDPLRRAERVMAKKRAVCQKNGINEGILAPQGEFSEGESSVTATENPTATDTDTDTDADTATATATAIAIAAATDPAPVSRHTEVTPNLEAIPALHRHEVLLRDRAQCVELLPDGSRCPNTRWIDIHHIKPRAKGGTNDASNLVTLCSGHHRMLHAMG